MSADQDDVMMDTELVDKGKGKAVDESMATEHEEEEVSAASSDEEAVEEPGPVEDEDLAAMDPSNILPPGQRTRGKRIDFSDPKLHEGHDDNDDEDDDEDFEDPTAEESDNPAGGDRMEH